MKGGEMWEVYFGSGLRLGCLFALSLLLLFSTLAHAEPYAQIPLPEFKALIGRVDKMQQREKLYIEKDKISAEKDRVQTDYIAKLEQANDTIAAYATKLEEHNAKLEQLANDPRWTQRLQDWGTASGVTSAVLYLGRKLILKF
jgi:hypothetical protein